MKLSEWARQQGIGYSTARRWFHGGLMPVPARRLPSGTIWVETDVAGDADELVAVYARVSSSDQRDDLDRHAGRVAAWAAGNRLQVSRVVTEVGSALNGTRRKLSRLLADPTVTVIVVEHRDRLARFVVEHLEAALAATGRRIGVVDDREVEDDLMRDMVEVLTCVCARLYGRRSAERRAAAAAQAAAAG